MNIVDRDWLTSLARGSIFSIHFFRRCDNRLRKMNCRLGVRKYLRNNSDEVRPRNWERDHDLITVYDLKVGGYRSIPLDRVTEIRARGQVINLQAQDDEIAA